MFPARAHICVMFAVGSYRDVYTVCMRDLNDYQLALVLCRLLEGDSSESFGLITASMAEHAQEMGDAFLLHIARFLQKVGHVMSCHVMSCHVMSCHVMSCHVVSCRVMSCHVVSCRVMSCHVMSCHVMSCHVMSCRVMSCHVMSCRVMSCHVM